MSEDAKAAKKRRLAEALRANLRRRKAAAAVVSPTQSMAAAPEPETDTGGAPTRGIEDEG